MRGLYNWYPLYSLSLNLSPPAQPDTNIQPARPRWVLLLRHKANQKGLVSKEEKKAVPWFLNLYQQESLIGGIDTMWRRGIKITDPFIDFLGELDSATYYSSWNYATPYEVGQRCPKGSRDSKKYVGISPQIRPSSYYFLLWFHVAYIFSRRLRMAVSTPLIYLHFSRPSWPRVSNQTK